VRDNEKRFEKLLFVFLQMLADEQPEDFVEAFVNEHRLDEQTELNEFNVPRVDLLGYQLKAVDNLCFIGVFSYVMILGLSVIINFCATMCKYRTDDCSGERDSSRDTRSSARDIQFDDHLAACFENIFTPKGSR